MSITIVVSDTVGVNVKGSINDANGAAKPFDFQLICRRLDAEAIREKLNGEGSLIDFLADVVIDWKSVKQPDGAPVPYSEDALRQLCKIAGVGQVAFGSYIKEVGAKEKN
jgi:hypothetical protein